MTTAIEKTQGKLRHEPESKRRTGRAGIGGPAVSGWIQRPAQAVEQSDLVKQLNGDLKLNVAGLIPSGKQMNERSRKNLSKEAAAGQGVLTINNFFASGSLDGMACKRRGQCPKKLPRGVISARHTTRCRIRGGTGHGD
ncbi:MAG: hypothetical protein ACLP2Y_02635 [Limisphaerales bacterium]